MTSEINDKGPTIPAVCTHLADISQDHPQAAGTLNEHVQGLNAVNGLPAASVEGMVHNAEAAARYYTAPPKQDGADRTNLWQKGIAFFGNGFNVGDEDKYLCRSDEVLPVSFNCPDKDAKLNACYARAACDVWDAAGLLTADLRDKLRHINGASAQDRRNRSMESVFGPDFLDEVTDDKPRV